MVLSEHGIVLYFLHSVTLKYYSCIIVCRMIYFLKKHHFVGLLKLLFLELCHHTDDDASVKQRILPFTHLRGMSVNVNTFSKLLLFLLS